MIQRGFLPYSQVNYDSFMDSILPALINGTHNEFPLEQCTDSCRGYHQAWPLLQVLQLISGLSVERKEIVQHLQQRNNDLKVKSVLIAATADFGLLSVLHEAFGETIKDIDVTVVDMCQTPLNLCSAYATQMGFEIETIQENLMYFDKEKKYDVIIGHSILSFIMPNDRYDFIDNLTSHLTSNGQIFLYQSIRPDKVNEILKFDKKETVQWIENAMVAYHKFKNRLQWLSEENLKKLIVEFCRVKQTYAVSSEANITDIFSKLGYHVKTNKIFSSEKSNHLAATPKSKYSKYVFRACYNKEAI